MTLQDLANIADIIAGVLVIASVLFLAVQIRQNTAQIRLAGRNKGIETQVHLYAHLTDTPEKADLVRRAMADFNSLTQAEKGLVHTWFLDLKLSHNAIRHAYEEGLLDKNEFVTLQENWISLMRTKGARTWYEGWKHQTPQDFQDYADAALDDPKITVKPLDEDVPWLFALEDADQNHQD